MPLKRTAALAISSLVVLGGGATALAATGTFSAAPTDPVVAQPIASPIPDSLSGLLPDPSTMPSFDGTELFDGITVDPATGALNGHGFTIQPPVTSPDGSATFSGSGPDGQSHSATITPGTDGGRPSITIDGHDLGSMLDQFLGQRPEITLPDPSAMPAMPTLPSMPPQLQQFLDQARSALDGALGGSLPQWPGMPHA